MSRLLIIVLLLYGQVALAQPTISRLKDSSDINLLINSILEARELKDRALAIYVARKIARNYPFSPSAREFLEAARSKSARPLENSQGAGAWFIPLGVVRIMVLLSGLLMAYRFRLKSARTAIFLVFVIGLIYGEAVNFHRGLRSTVFIPFEGDHFAMSAPDPASQAVEKLEPGEEILVNEVSGDWIKLDLPSGRIGWVLGAGGVIESED